MPRLHVSSSALCNSVEESLRSLRKGFSTEQRHRPVSGSGGDRTAGLATGCQRDRLNDRDWIPAAKLGGRCLSSKERIRTVSSRGARGRKAPGVMFYGPILLMDA